MKNAAEGSSLFRFHIACSLLSNRTVDLSSIHTADSFQGIQDYEANFLKFVDRISSGSKIEVENNNTQLAFTPGVLIGGSFTHSVPASRGVGYIIEAALLLLPFAKYPSEITFLGATEHPDDLSADVIRTVTCRWLQLFGVECSLRIVKHGMGKNPGGCVVLSVANVRKLRGISVLERGKVKRIRGIAVSCNTSLDLPQKAATAAKGVLLHLLPDIYVVCDPVTTKESTNGYGVMLVAETTTKKAMICQETVASRRELPEEVGQRAAYLLMDQIFQGGCVDSSHQLLVLLLMALTPDDVSNVRFGAMTSSGVSALVLTEDYFGVTCAIKEELSSHPGLPNSTVVSCIGSNAVNFTKRSG